MNVAIMGAGNIAEAMSQALNGLNKRGEDVCAYAVASRSLNKAEAFAKKWKFKKAYGSYEELVKDPEVDLIYIATPHAMHHDNAMLCLEHGKPILVEKAFCANAIQAEELIHMAKEKEVFMSEAMWTRFLPSTQIIKELLGSGMIGNLLSLEAEFSCPIAKNERLHEPALAGGALLDLGIYPLTFASLFFGDEVECWESKSKLYKTGVDGTDEITMRYVDGKVAHLKTSMVSLPKNEGKIVGTKGIIKAYDLNNFSKIVVYDQNHKLLKKCEIPKQINGYEYEVLACKKAMEEGKLECMEISHSETLLIMRWMDQLRKVWGVKYPFE